MVTRHNLCTNPALANNVTGWGGGSTPTQTAVSGFSRGFAARYTAGTFMFSAAGVATPALSYTASAYIRTASFNASGNAYLEWLNSGGGVIGDTAGAAYTTTSGVVTRVSVTGTSPANTASCRLVLDGVNYAVNSADITMVLIEQTALDTYFDGASPGATWDGTAGNSASTLVGGSQSGDVSQTITQAVTVAATNAAVGGAAPTTTVTTTVAGANATTAAATATTTATTTAAATRGTTGAATQTTTSTVTASAVAGSVAALTAAFGVVADAVVTAGTRARGSWYQLADIAKEAADMREAFNRRPPQACPLDGEPLEQGRAGVLHCRFDGWQYPRDYVRPG